MGSKHSDRLGVCLDTCHLNDAGYDVHDIDNILQKFDDIIGLDRLLVVHLNDSKMKKALTRIAMKILVMELLDSKP